MGTTLEGWAIPVKKEGPLTHLDHTYVKSSDGKRYGCWGRDDGGRMICKGKGDSKKAACLSSPRGKALIVYAVTGVCHQTANRILRPSRKTVKDAKAYAASWALYGAYGGTNKVLSPEWKGHEILCKVWGWDPSYLPEKSEREDYFEAIQNAHMTMATALRDKKASMREVIEEIQTRELQALVDDRFSSDLAATKISSLARSRADMLTELELDMMRLAAPESIREVGERANILLNEFLKSAADILEVDEFETLFEISPGTSVIVVDPDIALTFSAELQ